MGEFTVAMSTLKTERPCKRKNILGLGKQEQAKPRASIKKEVTRVREEIKGRKTEEKSQRIHEAREASLK